MTAEWGPFLLLRRPEGSRWEARTRWGGASLDALGPPASGRDFSFRQGAVPVGGPPGSKRGLGPIPVGPAQRGAGY